MSECATEDPNPGDAMAVPLASSQPCVLSRPKALQTLGCNWTLAEYYDWVLRQLNDSSTEKGGMGAAASELLRKRPSEIFAGYCTPLMRPGAMGGPD